jgi:hypothetical protein
MSDRWAGERARTRNRRTGTTSVLVDAAEQLLDEAAGRWATICDEHATIVNHETQRLARMWLHHSEDWCEDCMALPAVSKSA